MQLQDLYIDGYVSPSPFLCFAKRNKAKDRANCLLKAILGCFCLLVALTFIAPINLRQHQLRAQIRGGNEANAVSVIVSSALPIDVVDRDVSDVLDDVLIISNDETSHLVDFYYGANGASHAPIGNKQAVLHPSVDVPSCVGKMFLIEQNSNLTVFSLPFQSVSLNETIWLSEFNTLPGGDVALVPVSSSCRLDTTRMFSVSHDAKGMNPKDGVGGDAKRRCLELLLYFVFAFMIECLFATANDEAKQDEEPEQDAPTLIPEEEPPDFVVDDGDDDGMQGVVVVVLVQDEEAFAPVVATRHTDVTAHRSELDDNHLGLATVEQENGTVVRRSARLRERLGTAWQPGTDGAMQRRSTRVRRKPDWYGR